MHWIDPDYLPETSGLVDCFLMNGEGEADGFVLTDGTEVHFPRHLSQAVLAVVRPGAILHVRGVRPRGVAMIAAVSVGPDEGEPIIDCGPPDHDGEHKADRKQTHTARSKMEAQGIVRQALHGSKGEVRGVLLEDGRAGRFPPHAAASVVGLIMPGQPILLRGDGLASPHGTVIAVRAIGTSAEDVRVLETEKPRTKKHNKKHKHRPHDPVAGGPQAIHPL